MTLRVQYRREVPGHARRLVGDLFRAPLVTVPEAQQALGVSNATARKAVRDLQEWGDARGAVRATLAARLHRAGVGLAPRPRLTLRPSDGGRTWPRGPKGIR
jgi:hypothetical protein